MYDNIVLMVTQCIRNTTQVDPLVYALPNKLAHMIFFITTVLQKTVKKITISTIYCGRRNAKQNNDGFIIY